MRLNTKIWDSSVVHTAPLQLLSVCGEEEEEDEEEDEEEEEEEEQVFNLVHLHLLPAFPSSQAPPHRSTPLRVPP